MSVHCPSCGSHHVITRNVGRKIGGATGAAQATAAWVMANVTIVRGYRIDGHRWLAVIGHVRAGGIVVRPIFAQQPVKLPEVQHQDG